MPGAVCEYCKQSVLDIDVVAMTVSMRARRVAPGKRKYTFCGRDHLLKWLQED